MGTFLSPKTPVPWDSLSPSSAFPRLFFSSAHGSAAEDPFSVFLSLEQGLSLHRLNFSFAAEFLSPNDWTEAAASWRRGCG